ncbi:unnamed protein product [Zymoseptoria tritici ST99CH_1A5]|uniref:BZIP domain-containing protein n=1 Tax=Zymoseptoria tritici ST99CH_1A5 TaxID=1276529 RepID=A0A1Y6M4N0_ZYMTR|nr:unnamed protein product [Zymoseptoria tritici ST99CH_1A5]
MSSCRIERKRAHDREAQRASRAKTKAKIEHLEKTVKDLTEASGNNRTNYLAQHASEQAQEIDTLQNLVTKIRTLINDATKTEPEQPAITAAPKSEDDSPESATDFTNSAHTNKARSNSGSSASPSEDQWDPPEASKTNERELKPIARAASSTRNLMVLGVNMLCENTDDNSYSTRLNQALERVEQTPDNLSNEDEDQDILVRAMVFGWDAAERVHHFDIGWRFLRALDEGLWWRAGACERFANTWQMRNTLVHKIHPKNQKRRILSDVAQPTIQQQASLGHPAVADYFVWPDVRNVIVANGIRHISGKSTIAFAESFRFIWPYELRDMYKVNKTTGMCEVSEHFKKSVNSLSSYRMEHHSLLPYFSQPIATPTATGLAEKTGKERVGGNEDTTEVTITEMPTVRTGGHGNDALNACSSGIMQDVADWMTPFQMDLGTNEAAVFGIDSYTLAQEIGMAQWPAI